LKILIFLFLIATACFGQLSPGDLHQTHEHLEGIANCTKCHESGQQLASKKCLSCHVILKEKIEQKLGLHARKEYLHCENCHVEHQGKDFDLIYWEKGKEKFDHSLTGYTLQGKHSELKCRNCHHPDNIPDLSKLKNAKKDLKRTFIGLQQDCLTCHHNEHRRQVSENCLSCHSMDSWKQDLKFDHSQTKYSLTGKHRNVDCVKCHPVISDNIQQEDKSYLRFTGIKHNTCTSCHRDIHIGKLGTNCQTCHNTKGWQVGYAKYFDHAQTSYPLRGKHSNLKCQNCHKPGKPLKIAQFRLCTDCHQDFHAGQFKHRDQKGACEECHSVDGFVPSLFSTKQHKTTQYALTGAHLAIPCIACHKKTVSRGRQKTIEFHFKSTRCRACHENPHKNQVDRFLSTVSRQTKSDGCEHCHQTKDWSSISFEHDLTSFALDGRHIALSCSDCHQNKQKDELKFKLRKNQCSDCHQDVHFSQFKAISNKTTDCLRCHSTTDWLAEKFDHNINSKFKLSGAHQTVPCSDCHHTIWEDNRRFIRYKPLDMSCKSCHNKNPEQLKKGSLKDE